MGILIDSGVFITCERQQIRPDFARWQAHGLPHVSVITVSELFVGIWRADTETRRVRRQTFVDNVLADFPVVGVTLGVAIVHAELNAKGKATGKIIGVNDLWIAATALSQNLAVLTTNVSEFSRIDGLTVLDYLASK